MSWVVASHVHTPFRDTSISKLVIEKMRVKKAMSDEYIVTPSIKNYLHVHAERMKKTLNHVESAKMMLEEVEVMLTREEYESLLAPLLQQTMTKVKEALDRKAPAAMDVSELTRVIMVGGSSRIPHARVALSDLIHQSPFNDVDDETFMDVDTIVCTGAGSIAAAHRFNESQNILDNASTQISLEIEHDQCAVR